MKNWNGSRALAARFASSLRVVTLAWLFMGVGWTATPPAGADWPTYQHDDARSGWTRESLPLPLQPRWTLRSALPPLAAWDEPATWDGYNKVYDLPNRQVFDKVFHVCSAENSVFFGSSVDDQIRCLDIVTGAVRWTFFTEGPVRLAPVYAAGRVYVGSDDGCVYCLRARDGALLWKQRLAPQDRRVAGNERLVSLWPVRSGLVVKGGQVYGSAGVFPSETVYVAALDAETGSPVWSTPLDDFPAQGYLLASEDHLYVTTGRDRPLVFDRLTGQRLYQVKGGRGGTYALLTQDTFIYGPGREGQISISPESGGDEIASFEGNHLVVTGETAFLHTSDELVRLDRGRLMTLKQERARRLAKRNELTKLLEKATGGLVSELRAALTNVTSGLDALDREIQECLQWKVTCDCPYSMIVAGQVVVVGGDGAVAAYDTADGRALWRHGVEGKAYGLAAAQGCLLVSTDQGAIHAFAADALSAGSPATAATQQPLAALADQPPAAPEDSRWLETGPFIASVDRRQWQVQLATTRPMRCTIDIGREGRVLAMFPGARVQREHLLTMTDLPRDDVYQLRIRAEDSDGRESTTPWMPFDPVLHYRRPPAMPPAAACPLPTAPSSELASARARALLDHCATENGYALLLGGDGHLAWELARRSRMQIVVVLPRADQVETMRTALADSGVYGSRITVLQSDWRTLPWAPFVANLTVVDLDAWKPPPSPRELGRLEEYLVRPAGGVMAVISAAGPPPESGTWTASLGNLSLWLRPRPKLAGAVDWTHQYGLPDNAAGTEDEVLTGDISVLWWGRPGPRPMPDRGPRNPAPVSASGRLYIQGNRTLFGLDAYNGSLLWFWQIPTMRRANVPRDGSNMVAADEGVYVAVGDRCLFFAGDSGKISTALVAIQPQSTVAYDWGFLACSGNLLYGSSVRRGAQYLGDDGEWYEDFGGSQVARVTSEALFAVDRFSGQVVWEYRGGRILNSTISISDGKLSFVESRNPQALESGEGRLFEEVQQNQLLVCLDAATGEKAYDRTVDFSQCEFSTYATAKGDVLLVAGADRQRNFHLYALRLDDGTPLWEDEQKARKTHHSGQLAHPTIVGDRIYVNKLTYDLRSGAVLHEDPFDWHGCGVMSASKDIVFQRFEYHGMLDLKTNKRTEFLGVRSGCWLSLIPSGGLLLAPETSAGCSCTHAIQTSLGYVPRHVLEKSPFAMAD